MKKFLIKLLLFILLLLIIVSIGFILPTTPRASKSLLFAKNKKDSLLIHIDKPRIILIGGSNLSFGINSKLIKDSLNLNPINTSIHFGLGLDYMMNNTLKNIKNEDIVVLSPEYNHFFGDFVYGEKPLMQMIGDVDFSQILDLNVNQFRNIYRYIPSYCLSKLKPSEYFNIIESDVYSVNSFNQYGDVFTHWKMKQQSYSPILINGLYNPNTIKLILNFKMAIEKRGAKLYITYPSYQASSYDKGITHIKRIEKELIIKGFELLGTPERYRIPDSLMFNSSYHLLKKGVDYRTQLLIEDLMSKLK